MENTTEETFKGIADTIEILRECKGILEDVDPMQRYYILRMLARDFAEVDGWSDYQKEGFSWDLNNK